MADDTKGDAPRAPARVRYRIVLATGVSASMVVTDQRTGAAHAVDVDADGTALLTEDAASYLTAAGLARPVVTTE